MPIVKCYECGKVVNYDHIRKSNYCGNELCSVDLLVAMIGGRTKAGA